MTWTFALLILTGFNFLFWLLVSITRFAVERLIPRLGMKLLASHKGAFNECKSRKFLSTLFFGLILSSGGFIVVHLAILFIDFSSVGDVGALAGVFSAIIWFFLALVGGYVVGRIRGISWLATFIISAAFLGISILKNPLGNLDSLNILVGFALFVSVFLSVLLGEVIGARVLRFLTHKFAEHKRTKNKITVSDVAVIIPAYNEEITISKTIEAALKNVKTNQIYVGSDASSDNTVKLALSFGCNVVDIQPNRGKAGVLKFLIEYFSLEKNYKAILIVDADSELDKDYLKYALPLFNDSKVVAVAGHAKSRWVEHKIPNWKMFFPAYRTRLYKILQVVFRYSQTWKYTNVTSIIPGFASMYLTDILKEIDIDTPGLCIEDFNMTFEVHHKKLGRIAYDPRAFATSQDPFTMPDYFRQVKRWNLGLWQTVKKHGFWKSFFSITLFIFLAEIILQGLIFLTLPLSVLWLIVGGIDGFVVPLIGIEITLLGIAIVVFAVDYLITVMVALSEKKPLMLIYGLGFIILRYLDAILMVVTLPMAFILKSEGSWKSPTRLA